MWAFPNEHADRLANTKELPDTTLHVDENVIEVGSKFGYGEIIFSDHWGKARNASLGQHWQGAYFSEKTFTTRIITGHMSTRQRFHSDTDTRFRRRLLRQNTCLMSIHSFKPIAYYKNTLPPLLKQNKTIATFGRPRIIFFSSFMYEVCILIFFFMLCDCMYRAYTLQCVCCNLPCTSKSHLR